MKRIIKKYLKKDIIRENQEEKKQIQKEIRNGKIKYKIIKLLKFKNLIK
jgi:hypothetical protein